MKVKTVINARIELITENTEDDFNKSCENIEKPELKALTNKTMEKLIKEVFECVYMDINANVQDVHFEKSEG